MRYTKIYEGVFDEAFILRLETLENANIKYKFDFKEIAKDIYQLDNDDAIKTLAVLKVLKRDLALVTELLSTHESPPVDYSFFENYKKYEKKKARKDTWQYFFTIILSSANQVAHEESHSLLIQLTSMLMILYGVFLLWLYWKNFKLRTEKYDNLYALILGFMLLLYVTFRYVFS